MSDAVVRSETAAEYFKALVDEALARQRISTGELTAYYVVNLLTGFLRRPAEGEETPLAIKLGKALDVAGTRQRELLKQVGDQSLFISGFFGDSLHRRRMDVAYYVNIGGIAYTALSRYEVDTFSSVFAELADNFVAFVDVLSDVSERASCTACSSNADLLRLYERWLRTGSRRSGAFLIEQGVALDSTLLTRIQ